MSFIYNPLSLPLPDYALLLEQSTQIPQQGTYLHFDHDGIALCAAGEKGVVRVDFANGAAHYRRTKGGGELIAKAVNHTQKPTVWDATGGLGRDAFVLAGLGLNVRVFEQNPAVFCLLADGLHRAMQNNETAYIAQRIQLHHGNAADLMPQCIAQFGKPDVVYLDPMYPERQKSAAVKKEMAYFHDLIGKIDTQNDEFLFSIACQTATKRIVVKRPRLGEFLCGKKPAYQYSGKSTRFDVYLPQPTIQQPVSSI